MCEVLESIINDAILEHVNKYKLIKDTPHGFTKGKSGLTNLLKILEYVTDYIDQGYPVPPISGTMSYKR